MNMKKNNQGFSLLEIFISLSVGLVLFAGVMSVFVGMRTTTAETSSLGTLQENGRFALNVITEDFNVKTFEIHLIVNKIKKMLINLNKL